MFSYETGEWVWTSDTIRVCGGCGDNQCRPVAKESDPPTGNVHWRRAHCHCGWFMGWAPKPPDDPTKYRPAKRRGDLVAKHSPGHCELCLRAADSLPGQHGLEAHHVLPVEQGGVDDRANLWIVCAACHKLIHHQRTYHGRSRTDGR